MNIPRDEAQELAENLGAKNMGYLFENAEKMDIQAERRNTREARERAEAAEVRAMSAERALESAESELELEKARTMLAENAMRGLLGKLVGLYREEGLTKEETRIRLREFYQVSESDLNIYFEGIWKED